MQTKFGFSVLFITVALVVSVGRANPGTRSPEASQIERGRYLAEEVAKCAECHTPRNAQGELDRHAWLEGAPIWIMPVKPIPNWADRAPALAGFPGLTEEQGEESSRKEQGLRAKRCGRRCTSTT
jgi:mono/diheme cytochrome c family protein